jgi:hypothetical protein
VRFVKRIVDIFDKGWSHEILWTYIIELGDTHQPPTVEAFEIEALRLAIEENRGDLDAIFSRVRE